MKLSDLKPNPKNPRVIKDSDFFKLVESIREFPKMLSLRPMVIDNGIVLGGNMRLKALKELGYKEIPDDWVKKASDLTEEEKQRFILADNYNPGMWDFDALKEWDATLRNAYDLTPLTDIFDPNLKPIQGSQDVTDADIAKETNRLVSQMKNEGKHQTVICPHCGEEFKIS